MQDLPKKIYYLLNLLLPDIRTVSLTSSMPFLPAEYAETLS